MHAFAGSSLIGAKKQRGVTAITLIQGKSIREVDATQRVPSGTTFAFAATMQGLDATTHQVGGTTCGISRTTLIRAGC